MNWTKSKHNSLFFATVIILLTVILESCRTTSIPLDILVPAEINLPPHIKKLVIANRSLPADNKKVMNILEGLVTGESILADRYGGENCIQGLGDKLNEGPRFQAFVMKNSELRGTGTKEFAPPLDWYSVEQICRHYQADALVLLETFDTDIFLDKKQKITKKEKDSVIYEEITYIVDLSLTVNCGWRIYDPKNHLIVDQNVFSDTKRWRAEGPTEEEAMKKLPPKRQAINEAGYFAGQRFAVRISPSWMHVSRAVYTGKYEEFKRAKRYILNNDWDEAIDIWKRQLKNPDPKAAGWACFNLGIASEVKGQLNNALEWMKKAYYDYHIKKANAYIKIYKQRIEDQKRLEVQMKGVHE